ncbi:acyl-CoA dehydrogenase family protein [Haloechinothrix halophila]|uniref:acyl-CoA dehydrogenase family protein n=1 Tax=Haloechinothrix halophila TaxID=1069073 RepID=UPI00042A83AE|nr:acyl-CoA dehydrogenase family protein [Haloechinothrix halophila]
MDFSLTEAQHDLAGLARRILTDWAEQHPDRDLGGFDRELWRSMAKAGLLDAALPAETGGGGFGLLEQCSLLIEIGRTAAPVPYLASVTAASSLARFGTPTHVERWILPVSRGEATMAVALADEGAPAPFAAQRSEDGWLVSGTHTAVLDGAHAAGFLCEVAADDGDALVVVPADAPGVTVSAQRTVNGDDAALVELRDVAVAAEDVLGESRSDAAALTRKHAIVGLCALQLGIVARALELTGEYTREREQFDKPIGSFQAVRQRLADAYIDVEAVRLTLWQAAWQLAEGLPAGEQVATAKFWAADAGHRVAHTAVHLHGGVGIDTDSPLHRYFAAAKRAEFALGGATSQLRTLGSLLAAKQA